MLWRIMVRQRAPAVNPQGYFKAKFTLNQKRIDGMVLMILVHK